MKVRTVVVAVGVLGICVFVWRCDLKQREKWKANTEARARFILYTLQCQATHEDATLPGRSTNQLIDALAIRPSDIPLEFPTANVASGCILDPWGSPIWWIRKAHGEAAFVSFGPNGRDEKGAGDDVVWTWTPHASTVPSRDLPGGDVDGD